MNIHRLDPQNIKEIRALWLEGFPGDELFFDRFIRNYHVWGQDRGLWDDALSAQLFWRSYEIFLRGKTVKVPFILGVATALAQRKKGYARHLLEQTLQDFYAARYGFCMLYPFNEGFYERLGWTATYPLYREDGIQPGESGTGELIQKPPLEQMKACYTVYTHAKNGYVVRSGEDWVYRLMQYNAPGGWIYGWEVDGQLAAYALGEKQQLQEGAYRNIGAYRSFLSELSKIMPELSVQWHDRVEGATGQLSRKDERAMTRIVHLPSAFSVLPCPNQAFAPLVFRIIDELLPQNSGIFSLAIEEGHWHLSPSDIEPVGEIHITQLTKILMGAPLEGKQLPPALHTLVCAFPQKRNIIFEPF